MESIVLRYDKGESIGSINSVDTGMATAIIDSDDVLSQLQINQLIAIQSPKSGRYIIAMIVKIYRKATDMTLNDDEDEEDTSSAFNQVRLVLWVNLWTKLESKVTCSEETLVQFHL